MTADVMRDLITQRCSDFDIIYMRTHGQTVTSNQNHALSADTTPADKRP